MSESATVYIFLWALAIAYASRLVNYSIIIAKYRKLFKALCALSV